MNTGLPKKSKKLVWIVVILTTVVLIMFILNSLAEVYYRSIVKNKIIQLVSNSTAQLYKIETGNIHINFIRGEISVQACQIEANKVSWQKFRTAEMEPANHFSIFVPEISLSLKDFYRALFYGEFHVERVKLLNPEIQIENDSTNNKFPGIENLLRSVPNKKNQASSFLHKLLINSIEVSGGTINYIHKIKGNPKFYFQASGLTIHVENLLFQGEDFHSLSLTHLLETLNYTILCKNINFKHAHGRYLWKASDLEIQDHGNEIALNSFSLLDAEPQLDAGKRGVSDDRISLTSGSIQIHRSNLFDMLKTGKIYTPKISVEGLNFTYLSADTTIKKKIYRMPQEFLKASSQRITIDSLKFKKCNFNYEEIPTNGGPAGSIRFLSSEGLITNITNDPIVVKQNPALAIYARTRLYGTGKIETSVNFDLQSTSFNYSVKMGYFSLRQVNAITVPLSSLNINRGYINDLNFNASGDGDHLNGKLAVNYRNLGIKILQNDTGMIAKKRMRIINSLANAFLVLDDNPIQNEPLREELVSYSRNNQKSFFNYIWKSMLSGIKPSIGLSAERETEIDRFKRSFDRFRKWQKESKPERVRRRKIRKERRMKKSTSLNG